MEKYTLEAKDNTNGERTYLGTIWMEKGRIVKEAYSGLKAPLVLQIEEGRPVLRSPFKPGVEGIVTQFAA